MATKRTAAPASHPELSITESAGTIIRAAQDAQLGVVRGYVAASDPQLVEARKAHNAARTSAITAKLLADLAK